MSSLIQTELLRKSGEAIYGAHWQTPLAKRLGVSDRTVRRWLAGDSPTPGGVFDQLQQLCDLKRAQLYLVRGDLLDHQRLWVAPVEPEA